MSETPESVPSITIRPNGPYVITGIKVFTNSKGEPLPVSETMKLCRCGHSQKKPFCDGSHRDCGFVDEKN